MANMHVEFASKKLKRECESGTIRGRVIGRKVIQRINQLCASANLSDVMQHLKHLHCHKLEPKSAGQYALKVTDNFRLVFEPIDETRQAIDPSDVSEVTAVRILDVIDYH